MEKKNINTGVVRTCTILLLTVFTIGRKYGQGQNAENLINSLQQQTCACCLNFNDVSEVAKVIDRAKNQLQQDKEELKGQKRYLEGQLEVTRRQAEEQEGKLREEIQKKENKNEKGPEFSDDPGAGPVSGLRKRPGRRRSGGCRRRREERAQLCQRIPRHHGKLLGCVACAER